jgi:hypothetical protein
MKLFSKFKNLFRFVYPSTHLEFQKELTKLKGYIEELKNIRAELNKKFEEAKINDDSTIRIDTENILGYYAKDSKDNLLQFEWGENDKFYIIRANGKKVIANADDYEILEICFTTADSY